MVAAIDECVSVRYHCLPMISKYRMTDALHDLHLAIRMNRPDLVLFLLRSHPGLNLNSNLMRISALSLAVRKQNEVIVRILLEYGCELNKLSSDESGRLETPLYTAARIRNKKIVEILLMNGANPNITDFDNHTPLFVATKEKSVEICRLLIEYGANLNIPERTGQTPLHLACKYPTGREEIAKLLIAHGANLHLADFKRRIALDFAELSGNVAIMCALIEAGSPISKNMKDRIRNMQASTSERQEEVENAGDRDNNFFLSKVVQKKKKMWTLEQLANLEVRNLLRSQKHRFQKGCSVWPLVDSMHMIPAMLRDSLKMNHLLLASLG